MRALKNTPTLSFPCRRNPEGELCITPIFHRIIHRWFPSGGSRRGNRTSFSGEWFVRNCMRNFRKIIIKYSYCLTYHRIYAIFQPSNFSLEGYGYKQIGAEHDLRRSIASQIYELTAVSKDWKNQPVINWSKVEEILMAHYTVGISREAPTPILHWCSWEASPPEWYRIDSDPELENQINDRISFKSS